MRAAAFALLLVTACQVKVDANTQPPAAPATRAVPPGPTPAVSGNHETVELAEGRFKGDLVVSGNHNTVRGAGYGKTIVDGRLVMTGNHNTVESMTVEYGGSVEGNHNDAEKVQFHGDVTSAGNKNE